MSRTIQILHETGLQCFGAEDLALELEHRAEDREKRDHLRHCFAVWLLRAQDDEHRSIECPISEGLLLAAAVWIGQQGPSLVGANAILQKTMPFQAVAERLRQSWRGEKRTSLRIFRENKNLLRAEKLGQTAYVDGPFHRLSEPNEDVDQALLRQSVAPFRAV